MFNKININKYTFKNSKDRYKFLFWWSLKKYMKDFNISFDEKIKFLDESFYLSTEEEVYFFL